MTSMAIQSARVKLRACRTGGRQVAERRSDTRTHTNGKRDEEKTKTNALCHLSYVRERAYSLKQVCIYIIISLRQHLNKTKRRTKKTQGEHTTQLQKKRVNTLIVYTQINKHHHPACVCVCVSCIGRVRMHVVLGRGARCMCECVRAFARPRARAYGAYGNTRNIQFNTIVTRKSITFNAHAQRPLARHQPWRVVVSPLSSPPPSSSLFFHAFPPPPSSAGCWLPCCFVLASVERS